jgi:hypothetical protein
MHFGRHLANPPMTRRWKTHFGRQSLMMSNCLISRVELGVDDVCLSSVQVLSMMFVEVST